MKKKPMVMIAILILVAAGMGIFFGIKNNTKILWKELYLSKWNDPYARYMLCRANVKGKVYTDYGECTLAFDTKSRKEDIVNTNKADYLGEITYHYSCLEFPASLFYSDNNYYVLFYDEKNGYYRGDTCHISYCLDYQEIFIPSPVYLNIDFGIFRLYAETDDNLLDFLYDNYSFEEAKEFYGRLSEDLVTIDEKKQRITIDGYDSYENVMVEECVTLDFKNRTLIGKRANGELITLDGTETRDPRRKF